MKKFKFSLESLLSVRTKLEEEQKNKLSLAASEYQKVLQKRDDFFHQIEESRKKYQSCSTEGEMSIMQLKQFDHLRFQAEQLAYTLDPEIEEKRQLMETERQKYNQRFQEKRAIEILKEKELKIYKAGLLKQEQINIDEITKTQYHKSTQKRKNDFS